MKELVSDKHQQRQQEKSMGRESFDQYTTQNANSLERKGYYDQVENPSEHSYLSRLGESNRHAQKVLKQLMGRNIQNETF